MLKLGVVSFLNSRPLVYGLTARPDVACVFDVPANLPARLARGDVEVALLPVIDVLRRPGEFELVSDGCIGCDGETMTVRVFSQVPPDRISALHVDPHSHTSVALARVLWRRVYQRELEMRPFADERAPADAEAVLLIGDKVVDPSRGSFAYEIDLGGAWRQHTGLPFVFAAWATPQRAMVADDEARREQIARILCAARDAGVAAAEAIAHDDGPALGWPVAIARRYLTRCLRFRLDERMRAGADLFARECAGLGLVPAGTVLPPALIPTASALAASVVP